MFKGIFSDLNNILLWHESEDRKKNPISKISVDSINVYKLCMHFFFIDYWVDDTFLRKKKKKKKKKRKKKKKKKKKKKMFSFHKEMISA